MGYKNLLPGIGLRGYRSFGGEVQKFGPLQQVNLLVGTNNSGKSNVLRFLHQRLVSAIAAAKGNGSLELNDLDRPRNCEREGATISFAWSTEEVLESGLPDRIRTEKTRRQRVEKILSSELLADSQGQHWIPYACGTSGGRLEISKELIKAFQDSAVLNHSEWKETASLLRAPTSGGTEEWIKNTLERLSPVLRLPELKVEFIPAIREVGNEGISDGDWSGTDVITRLFQYQSPHYDSEDDREKFDEVNRFLKTVTGNPDAELEIPHTRKLIQVRLHDRLLPLESLGTGIHEVVILAAAATIISESIVCIEEPEVHLHPTLQRKLLRYLRANTDNQYVIATHSAHILDIPGSSVFHLRLEDGWTVVDTAVTDRSKFQAAYDLGYRASDLLQSNCIVWVEGPSDRVYLNHWIKSVASELIEGLHYSIMFYGGSVLRHLSADDRQIDEFVSLQRLNRNVALIMDSDRKAKEDRRNRTKLRVENEIEELGGFVWSTAGREVENYVSPAIMLEAIKALDSSAHELVVEDRFDLAHCYNRGKDKTHDMSNRKVELAHAVATRKADLDRLDLGKQIEKLVQFIRSANEGLLS